MSKPVLLTVDDDVSASHAVARDLRRRYGEDYQVLRVESGPAALEALRELAERVGLSVTAELPFYDLVVVGGGPAGLGAAVYSASEGRRTLLAERAVSGGQAGQSSRIEHYLSFPAGISGAQLARRANDQCRKFDVEILAANDVVGVANSAGQAAVHFSRYARTVTLPVCGDSLRRSMLHYLDARVPAHRTRPAARRQAAKGLAARPRPVLFGVQRPRSVRRRRRAPPVHQAGGVDRRRKHDGRHTRALLPGAGVSVIGREVVTVAETTQRGVYAGAVRAFILGVQEAGSIQGLLTLAPSRFFRLLASASATLMRDWFPMATRLLERIYLGIHSIEAKPVGAGSGLGLEISKRIVEASHHGALTFTSEPGRTSFMARLPLRAVAP
jgi:hypothetical protein